MPSWRRCRRWLSPRCCSDHERCPAQASAGPSKCRGPRRRRRGPIDLGRVPIVGGSPAPGRRARPRRASRSLGDPRKRAARRDASRRHRIDRRLHARCGGTPSRSLPRGGAHRAPAVAEARGPVRPISAAGGCSARCRSRPRAPARSRSRAHRHRGTRRTGGPADRGDPRRERHRAGGHRRRGGSRAHPGRRARRQDASCSPTRRRW